MSQSTVSRSVQVPGPRNFGPSFMQLCSFANIPVLVERLAAGARAQRALAQLWDGSTRQDEVIATLLDAVRAVHPRSGAGAVK